MENNKVYFEELIERIKVGDYKKTVELRDCNGCQVKFGNGVMLTINLDTSRAVINLFDNSEVDAEELYSLVQAARMLKAKDRVNKAKEKLEKIQKASAPIPKKTFWQKLFKK